MTIGYHDSRLISWFAWAKTQHFQAATGRWGRGHRLWGSPIWSKSWAIVGSFHRGKPMENLWKTYGKPMENQWKAYGKPMENPWKTHGKPMENLWKTHWKPVKHLWKTYDTYEMIGFPGWFLTVWPLVEGSLEVKLPTICRDGKSRGGKSQRGEVKKWEDKRWRKSEERRCRCAKR